MLAYLGAWAGLICGIIALFSYAEETVTQEIRTTVSRWLRDISTRGLFSDWPKHFIQIFDGVFGKRHLSLKCLVRSCLSSLIFATIVFFVLKGIFPSYSSESKTSYLQYPSLTLIEAFFLYIISVVLVNLIADYCSLLESRYVIKLINNRFSLTRTVSLLLVDILITIIIWLIIYVSFQQFLAKDFVSMSFMSRSISFMLAIIYNRSPNFLFDHALFFSTFFTSVWVWLYIVSVIFVKTVDKIGIGIDVLKKILDIKKKPIRALGFVATLQVTIIFLAYLPFHFVKSSPMESSSILSGEVLADTSISGFSFNLLGIEGSSNISKPLFPRVLKNDEEDFGEDFTALGAKLNYRAKLLMNEAKYDSAESFFFKVLETRKKFLGEIHPDVANTINHIAHLALITGQLSKADSLLRRALAIQEKVLGHEHPNVAITLEAMAKLYEVYGQFDEAEKLYQNALKINKEKFGQVHQKVAKTLHDLGVLQVRQRKFGLADSLVRSALRIQEKALDENHPNLLTSLWNLGFISSIQKKYPQAESFYRRALTVLEAQQYQPLEELTFAYYNLGVTLGKQSKYSDAERAFRKARNLAKQQWGSSHRSFSIMSAELALSLVKRRAFAEADSLLEQALRSFQEPYDNRSKLDVAKILKHIAESNEAQKRYSLADSFYERAIALIEDVLGANAYEAKHIRERRQNLQKHISRDSL